MEIWDPLYLHIYIYTFLDPLNPNKLTLLFSQVINLGKLRRSRLTQINHIIETMWKINNTTI